MAPITWKNVAAPDFTGSLYAMAQAGKTMDGAFDSLTQVLNNIRDTRQDNWKNQSRINTESEIASIQALNDLAALRGQEDNFDLESVRSRNGAQADMGQINQAYANQLAKLRGLAVDNASAVGRQAAEQSGSTAEGAEAFLQSLIDNGARDSYASEQAALFSKNGMGIMQEALKEQNKKASAEFLSQYQGQDLLGKDISAIELEAQKKYGPNFDTSLISQGLSNIVANQAKAQSQRQTSLGISDNTEYRKAFKSGMDALIETGDLNAAMQKAGTNAEAILKLQAIHGAKAQLNPVQQQEVGQVETAVNNMVQGHTAKLDAEAMTIQEDLKSLNPIKNGLEKNVADFRGKNIEGVLAGINGKGKWGSSDINTIKEITAEYTGKLEPGMAEVIAVQSLQDIGGSYDAFWGVPWERSDNNIDDGAYKEAYRKNVNDYLKYKDYEKTANTKLAQILKKRQKAEGAVKKYVDDYSRRFTISNLKNSPYSVSKQDLTDTEKLLNEYLQ